MTFLVPLLLAVISCGLIVMPNRTATILCLRAPEERWLRVLGFLGLGWATVAFLTSQRFGLLPLSGAAQAAAATAKHFLGGIIVGLTLGLGVGRGDKPASD